MEKKDIFICHASGDKEQYVYPFVTAIREHGITYWLDEAEIGWGAGITRKINEGIGVAKYVVVFLTDSFLHRNWPQVELGSALNLEASTSETVVLPLLIAPAESIFNKYPLLRDKLYLKWDDGLLRIIPALLRLLDREYKNDWFYSHPAAYTGKVWSRLVTAPEAGETLDIQMRWGPGNL